MKKIIYPLLILLLIFSFSCNYKTKDKETYKILTYDDGNIKKISTYDKQGNTLVIMKFYKNGFLKEITYPTKNNNENRLIEFYKNSRLKGYYTIKNNIYSDSHIDVDSTGSAWGLYLINKDSSGAYLNQSIITNEMGTISAMKSYFLVHNSHILQENNKSKLIMDITIVGMKYQNSFAIIGDFDSLYNKNSLNMDTFYGIGNNIHCEIDIKEEGVKYIRGLVYDYNGSMTDSTYGREIYFTQKYQINL